MPDMSRNEYERLPCSSPRLENVTRWVEFFVKKIFVIDEYLCPESR